MRHSPTQSLVLLAALCLSLAAGAQTRQAVEYFHAGWGHYFVTAFPDEIAVLDGGAFGGAWTRTGQTFDVWPAQEPGTSPVCRFFSTSFSPRSSHFYTPFAGECDTLRQNKDWQFEAIAFHLRTPDAIGDCPAGTAPLYRLYNNGTSGAPNHRYTKSRTIVAHMRGQGWSSEGSGPDVTFACLPAQAPAGSTAAGIWTGTTSQNESLVAIVLEDGTFYIPYTDPPGGSPGAIFQGAATAAGGSFASTNGMHYGLGRPGKPVAPATLNGTYAPGSVLQLNVSDHRGARTLSATFVAGSDQPPALAQIVGSFRGFTGHSMGSGTLAATVTIDASGTITTDNANCTTLGTVAPRAGVAVFEWTAIGSGHCPMTEVRGVLSYDAALRRLTGYSAFGDRSDLYFLNATKQ